MTVHKPFYRTRELIQAIDADLEKAKETNDIGGAVLTALIIPPLLLPPVAIAEFIILPFEQAYERLRERFKK